MDRWQLQEAKARLSEVVKSSRERPQEITVRGRPAAVVLSKAAFDRLTRSKPGFVDFVRQSPLVGLKLDTQRDKSPARDVAV